LYSTQVKTMMNDRFHRRGQTVKNYAKNTVNKGCCSRHTKHYYVT